MRVFKPGYKGRDGSRRKTTKWYVEFKDHSECIRRIPAFASKPASTEMGRNFERLVAFHVSSGGQTDPKLTSWLEILPRVTKERLISIGLLDKKNVSFSRPLSEHLDDFEHCLASKGNTEAHVKLIIGRAKKVFSGCQFRFWSEISASRVLTYLGDLRSPQTNNNGDTLPGVSAQTFNFYLQAVKQFCRWMIKDGRASENPLSHLSRLNVKTDRRHDRRALDVDEIRLLLETTRNGPMLSGRTWSMTGPERAILYWLALETGIRSSELRSLTRASFDLDSDVPTVTVEAAYSKRRRRDVQPLRRELAGRIQSFIANLTPTTRIFKMPRKENVAVMYRSDLTNARKNWIDAGADPQSRANRKASDFLRYVDSQGRYADFHALRHSFITHLGRTGIHFKTAQDLARHSVPTLTARYTHGFKGDEVAAINALPDLSPRRLRTEEATGTDGTPAYSEPSRNSLAPCLPKKGRFPDNEVDSGILNNDKKAVLPRTVKAKKNKDFPDKNSVKSTRRWGARAVEWTGLENRRGLRVK